MRLFLGGFDLTPTYKAVHNKFSVKYFLNLVLVDDEDRRYFRQQEIFLWRKPPKRQKLKKMVAVPPDTKNEMKVEDHAPEISISSVQATTLLDTNT